MLCAEHSLVIGCWAASQLEDTHEFFPIFKSSSWRLPGSSVLELIKSTPKSVGFEGVVFVVQCILYAYTVYLALCGQKSHLFLFCLWLWTILPLYAFRWLDSTDRPFWQYVHPLSLSLLFNMNQSSFTEISWFASLLSYIWLCSFNCLIMHLFWWNPLNVLHHANFDYFIDWSVNHFIISLFHQLV